MADLKASKNCIPYIGLRAFEEADKRFFKGRRSHVNEVVRRLADNHQRFIAVVGPSGGGKSSLVLAGVVPALRAESLPNAGSQ